MKSIFKSKFYHFLKSEASFLLIGILMHYIQLLMFSIAEYCFPFDADFSEPSINIMIVGTFATHIICGCLWWFVLRYLLKFEILCNSKFPILNYILNCIYVLVILFYPLIKYSSVSSLRSDFLFHLLALSFWIALFIFSIKLVMPLRKNVIKEDNTTDEGQNIFLIKKSLKSSKVVNAYILFNSFILLVILFFVYDYINFSILDIISHNIFIPVNVKSYIDPIFIVLILFLINFIFNGYLYEKIINFKYLMLIHSINLFFVIYFVLFVINKINYNPLYVYDGLNAIWWEVSIIVPYIMMFLIFYLWSYFLFKYVLKKLNV